MIFYRDPVSGFLVPVAPQGPTGPTGVDGTIGGELGPTGPTGPTGPAGRVGLAGVKGPTGPAGYQGPKGPTGPQGDVGYDGDPSSGGYGSLRWRIVWGSVYVGSIPPYNVDVGYGKGKQQWSAGYGFTYQGSYVALVTGVKNNWGNAVSGVGITSNSASGVTGVVHNMETSYQDCYVAWMCWGYW